VRLGQNFLADQNLLQAIVRDAALASDDVALEIGGGEGALTERVASQVAYVHVIELDERLAASLDQLAESHPNVSVVRGDAMKVELAALEPSPSVVTSNLPYAIATPVLLRTIAELPSVHAWTVMVQREIADRLLAAPGSRTYGAPSVLVQLACDVELLRRVDPAVFSPRPRVESALLRLERRAAAAPETLAKLVRAGFAHRRKRLAGSVELAGGPSREAVRAALRSLGIDEDARAEALAPDQFTELGAALEGR